MVVPARPVSGGPIATDWGDVVHDTAVAVDMQSGSAIVTVAAATVGLVSVVFPRPFAFVPVVIATAQDSGNFWAVVDNITVSGFQLVLRAPVAITASVLTGWLAIGTRA